MLLLFQLLLTYLFTQFIVRPHSVIDSRARERWVFALYWIVYAGGAVLAINVGLNRPVSLAVLALGLCHAAIDQIDRRLLKESWRGFLLAQLVNLLLMLVTTNLLGAGSWRTLAPKLEATLSEPRLYLYVGTFIAVIAGGDVLVQRVAQSFLAKITADLATMKPGLPDAGRYIGWLERFLILTFVIARSYEAIGYLLAAKALVRYPEIKEDQKGHFGEYFLVGTLTSVGIALTAGVLIRWVIENFLPA